MRAVSTQGGGGSILVGVGAALATLVLIVLQVASSSGLFGASTTTTVTATTTPSPSSIQLYEVTFNETSNLCYAPYPSYVNRWFVTLGNTTIVEPSNVRLPLPIDETFGAAYQNISEIVFSVPDGSYRYLVSLGAVRGTADVNGSDVLLQVPSQFCN